VRRNEWLNITFGVRAHGTMNAACSFIISVDLSVAPAECSLHAHARGSHFARADAAAQSHWGARGEAARRRWRSAFLQVCIDNASAGATGSTRHVRYLSLYGSSAVRSAGLLGGAILNIPWGLVSSRRPARPCGCVARDSYKDAQPPCMRGGQDECAGCLPKRLNGGHSHFVLSSQPRCCRPMFARRPSAPRLT
jgi:hypothetical protein